MSEIHADGGPLPHIPDDLTIPQFILDTHHPARPTVTTPQAWLVEDRSGREIGSDEVRSAFLPAAWRCGGNLSGAAPVLNAEHWTYGWLLGNANRTGRAAARAYAWTCERAQDPLGYRCVSFPPFVSLLGLTRRCARRGRRRYVLTHPLVSFCHVK